MERDLVYLVWKNQNSGKKYKVAMLYKENGKYFFKYILENVKEAKKEGFELLISFPRINEVYENSRLFAVFGARLPDKSRPEIAKILSEYGMSEYDEFELLKRSGAKLPIDNYEFVKE